MPLCCFAGRGGGDPSPAQSSSATSVYWTRLGAITLTWSRAALGLVVAAELSLAGDGTPARFVLRPWLPWRRRGSRRFSASGHAVEFSWDLSRVRMAARRPEPLSRYFLRVSVDGKLALAAGDLASSSSSSPASAGLLLSRRENAVVSAARGDAYTTSVAVAGEKHEVSLAVEEAAMWVAVDGEKALQVRRLRWKFRGSETLHLPRVRVRVRVTWNLHGWLFAPDAVAVFVLRFDDDDANPVLDVAEGAGGTHAPRQSSFTNHRDGGGGGGGDSWCSSDSERRGRRRGTFRSGGSGSSPTVSVASTSVASSAASVAAVSEWATAEDAALQDGSGGGGFSLVVYLWKKKR